MKKIFIYTTVCFLLSFLFSDFVSENKNTGGFLLGDTIIQSNSGSDSSAVPGKVNIYEIKTQNEKDTNNRVVEIGKIPFDSSKCMKKCNMKRFEKDTTVTEDKGK